MKLVKNLFVFSLVTIIFSSVVSAQASNNVSFKADITSENVSVEKADIFGNDDNSKLQVKVVKQIGDESNVIYTGSLGEYENGIWSNLDFSGINFTVILNWNTLEDEVIYIIPISGDTDSVQTSLKTNSISNVYSERSTNGLDTNIKIVYNNEYYEAALKTNNTIDVTLDITNSGVSKDLICYLAEYSSTGTLVDLTSNSQIPVPANGSVTAHISKTFSNANVTSAKLFLWEKDNMKPIMSNILLNSQQTDFYADNYNDAQEYDISKKINGKINTVSDVDYIKFTPTETGKYVIHSNSTSNVSGCLYDSQNEVVKTSTDLNGGYYIAENLTAGNTYYLKTYGNNIGEYSIAITKMQNDGIVTITNDSIKLNQSYAGSAPATVKLFSAGTLVDSCDVTPQNNELDAEINIDNLQSAYTITVSDNETIVAVYDIKAVIEEKNYTVTDKSYVSVPVVVSNVTDFKNIYFSVAFDENKFMVADVCEHTYTTSETGIGLISSAEVNIKAIENNAVVFASTKNLTSVWNGTVNSVKLQAMSNGEYTVKTIAYSVK